MRKTLIVLLAQSSFWLSVCTGNNSSDLPEETLSSGTDNSIVSSEDDTPDENQKGTLELSFDFIRGSTPASNQYAVWVEDANGTLVKTLYVTDFTALGGYERRKESIPIWVSKEGPAEMSESDIDAISGATPKAGTVTYTWDGTDANGSFVPNGTYTICLEGTMYWTSSVLFSGKFELGGETQNNISFTSTFTEDESTNRDMLSNISASYTAVKSDTEDDEMNSDTTKTNALGGLSPEDALEYMKKTPNLVIVQVNTAQWYIEDGFKGAMWIPHTEIAERYDEIPKGVPVILHCGAGVVSVPAYEALLEKRPDIPELSYIAGRPPIAEYNEWVGNQ